MPGSGPLVLKKGSHLAPGLPCLRLKVWTIILYFCCNVYLSAKFVKSYCYSRRILIEIRLDQLFYGCEKSWKRTQGRTRGGGWHNVLLWVRGITFSSMSSLNFIKLAPKEKLEVLIPKLCTGL